ncbi:MAG: LysR family transcriptional regulator [Burkholderia sp.]|jgi:LysR family nitrogen assimilation transcriptional regulator|nr:LysR family transcriptional regulator [Burkholderia sp.]
MEFRQVQYFICLFEEGTVTRAARRLNIVQPALSMQIAKLEDDVGQRLFDRTKQGMVPTAAAHQMYRLFLPVMRDFSHARTQIMSTDGEISGHVNIGLIASITEGVLAETLSAFSSKYPNVGVRVADGYSATLTDWVAGGQIDAAIINKPRRQLALNVEHIVDEEMVLITGAGYSAVLPPHLTLRQISSLGLALVLPTREHGLRGILDSFAQQDDVDLMPKFEIDSLVTTVKLVEQTQLATILPRIAVHRGLSEGRLRSHAIVSPRLIRQVVAISHPRRPMNSATNAFIAMLTEQIRLRTQEQVAGEAEGTAGGAIATSG